MFNATLYLVKMTGVPNWLLWFHVHLLQCLRQKEETGAQSIHRYWHQAAEAAFKGENAGKEDREANEKNRGVSKTEGWQTRNWPRPSAVMALSVPLTVFLRDWVHSTVISICNYFGMDWDERNFLVAVVVRGAVTTALTIWVSFWIWAWYGKGHFANLRIACGLKLDDELVLVRRGQTRR
jgi:hypothetical protein